MKAITIKQPWASLIVEGIKDIENRTWKTSFRGRVLIHAGMNAAPFSNSPNAAIIKKFIGEITKNGTDYSQYPFGSIIGSVDIVDCVVNHASIWAEPEYDTICEVGGCHSPTCDGCGKSKTIKAYNWVLANPVKFTKPIIARGKLSFWESEIEVCHICGQPSDLICAECGDRD